ncbi:LuxR C-terminal-related transcriptional regulator [Phenylobacterium sp.]|jgi:DNA-binding CsgD family transcriptional regulator|uniref:LuxR C-terminal-related transcriptional regulator n=1 Tax=Phenylobacterium sp. TaxID=1871053 RepID=UPI002F956818
MSDLARLSDSERQALRLLAEGHTAKSVARELGLTEAAVNERLRQARRKTGAGSSRELARRRKATQETGDEKIGMVQPARGGENLVQAARRRFGAPVLVGMLAMIVIASAVGALAALAVSQTSAPPAPPRVVATRPAPGAQVAPGPLTLSVTFDRPMRPESYSFIMRDRRSFPACGAKPVLSADRRTFTLSCMVEPGRSYEVGFNNDLHRNFVGDDGRPATPAVLRFTTR